jgi:hypothetical protein
VIQRTPGTHVQPVTGFNRQLLHPSHVLIPKGSSLCCVWLFPSAPSPGAGLMMAAPVKSRALFRLDGESSAATPLPAALWPLSLDGVSRCGGDAVCAAVVDAADAGADASSETLTADVGVCGHRPADCVYGARK